MKKEIFEQQIEATSQRRKELWQRTEEFPTQDKQLLVESLQEHDQTLEELQVTLEELRSQNEELIASRQTVEIQRQRYQDLFELAPDAYLATNLDAVILEANQAVAHLLNISQEHLLGKPLVIFVTGKALQNFYTNLSQFLATDQVSKWEVEIQTRQGTRFPATFKVKAVRDSSGRVVELLWLLQDITERKRHEAAFQSDRHLLETQVEQRTAELLETNERLKQEIAKRQRAEKALWQRAEGEWAIRVITERIRQSLNLEEILNTTVAEIRQVLGSDRVLIFRTEPNGDGVVVAESVDADWLSFLGNTAPAAMFRECMPLYRQGNARVIDDIQQVGFPADITEFFHSSQVNAALGVPIMHGGRFWGLLAAHQCSAPRHWEPLEIDLLKQLAIQVSIGIQQSELYRQVQQLNTNLERQVRDRTAQLQQALDFEALLKRITDDVRDRLDENQILQVVVWELGVGLNIDGCDTGLYDADQTTSTISYEYTLGIPSAQGQVVQMADFWEGYSQLLQGKYFQFCQMVPDSRGALTRFACPIVDDQGVLGDLWLFKPQQEVFSELEIRLVQQVANQCAIALRQARLHQAARSQVEELEKLNRLKDDFLNTVPHELRTPVSNMKMAIQMLSIALNRDYALFAEMGKPREQQSKVARYFQILQNECEREIRLIDDLLDLQKLYAGAHPLLLSAIQLQEWLPPIVEPFQERARNHQQTLLLDLPRDLPRFICDPTTLGRILSELLENACKYTPASETIAFKVQSQPGSVQFSVSNSGVEIPERELPHIFDKFYRIPSNDPWKQGGTGLGLTIVKRLIAHLKGTLRVESKDRQTCFILELPSDRSAQIIS
ncbi:GAF domain-containing protein [Trichocoleus sp. Lan]|uniref:sensor histidine kinase n=1 Tax=Trichocoleus sp. Lan TaxID=2933927 RepID=UPI003298A6CA